MVLKEVIGTGVRTWGSMGQGYRDWGLRLETVHGFERTTIGRGRLIGVISEFCLFQEFIPVTMVFIDEGAEILFEGLDRSLSLTVCLLVMGCRHVKAGAQPREQMSPELGAESGITVGDDRDG